MKVYVAAKFEEKDRVRLIYKRCRENGLEVTCDWTVEDDTGMVGEERRAYHQKCAQADLDGVRNCDVLILLPHEHGKGMYFEMGAAIALGKRVIVVGQDSDDSHKPCIFCKLPQVKWMPDIWGAIIEAANP